MLRIEVDAFSGRPNPVWMITDADATRELLDAVAEAKGAATKVGAGYAGLGYREVRVSLVGDDGPPRRGVAREFALGSSAAGDMAASGRLARRVIEDMTRHADIRMLQHEVTPLSGELRDMLLEQLERFLAKPPRWIPWPPPPPNPLIRTTKDKKCRPACSYEISKFNPGFWNKPNVQPYNNCYNYALNWRTDTFAQPGRAHGAQTDTMACPNVTTAAMADGLVKRCDCLPDSEYPRRLMALVVAPDWDYHWYRHQQGGFWGHKPGQTAARNVDNSNVVITNPETCDRGPYTQFCGYFYAGRSVVIS